MPGITSTAAPGPRTPVMPELSLRIYQYLHDTTAYPAAWLTAQSLAIQFAALRWTVNEAFASLAEKGVVTYAPGHGYRLRLGSA